MSDLRNPTLSQAVEDPGVSLYGSHLYSTGAVKAYLLDRFGTPWRDALGGGADLDEPLQTVVLGAPLGDFTSQGFEPAHCDDPSYWTKCQDAEGEWPADCIP